MKPRAERTKTHVRQKSAKPRSTTARRFIIWLQGRTRRRIARQIRAAFKGVSWDRNIFRFGEHVTDVDGETKFYKVGEIDKAMKRVDALIAKLNKA